MNKAEIRKNASARRKGLSKDEVILLSGKLRDHFSRMDFDGVEAVHIFLPIAELKEPDTFMIIEWLKQHHPEIRIIVPKADFQTSLLTHHQYKADSGLQKSAFNIFEPTTNDEYTGKIDMVIIPLLAFDRRGYRVGYGKGFYDRFLEQHRALKIGLSFFESVDIIADIHANDVALDRCITPEGIVYF